MNRNAMQIYNEGSSSSSSCRLVTRCVNNLEARSLLRRRTNKSFEECIEHGMVVTVMGEGTSRLVMIMRGGAILRTYENELSRIKPCLLAHLLEQTTTVQVLLW